MQRCPVTDPLWDTESKMAGPSANYALTRFNRHFGGHSIQVLGALPWDEVRSSER